jgi:acetyl esterase/lipase
MIPLRQITHLTSRSFIVVTPEYRLCPQVDLYSGPLQDAKDVYSWCHSALPALLAPHNVHADGARIVVLGHSAGGGMALTTGQCTPRPKAIVDFYGCKGFSDKSWFEPLGPFAGMPDLPEAQAGRVFEGPQAFTSEAMFVAGKPNLADPRVAWYIEQIKHGRALSAIVPDGEYARCDPMEGVDGEFPPTYFLHGKADVFVKWELSQLAFEKLRGLGVRAELVTPEGVGHAFDLQMEEGSEDWGRLVVPALEWVEGFV